MADFQSKYSGEQVEEFLDQIANGEIGGGGGITVETDPVFSNSPAASITEEKKAEWDGKQDAIADLETIREGASKGATAVQEENIKTFNGESIVGSGNIEVSGGGEVYITPFTIEEFCSRNVQLTEDQIAELLEAATQDKIIGMRFDAENLSAHTGYTIADYAYRYYTEFDSWHLDLGVIYNGSYCSNYLNNEDEGLFKRFRLSVTNFTPSITDISVEDGRATVEDDYSYTDNRVFYVSGECTELHIFFEPSPIGETVRFFTGESCTLEIGYPVYWAIGEVPTIEPYTHYELSLVGNTEGVFNAVLTPFKAVE